MILHFPLTKYLNCHFVLGFICVNRVVMKLAHEPQFKRPELFIYFQKRICII